MFASAVAALAAAGGPVVPPGATPSPGVAHFEPVSPGGDTACARGGDFTFFYKEGSVNKLVVEFEGGGACWSALTCVDMANACTKTVDPAWDHYMLNANWSGIHDARNYLGWGDNPFSDWNHVYVPYCTCDAHTGTKDHNYGLLGGTVRHRGHANFQAVLGWMLNHVPASPDVVATTGCSAGSLGATANWPYLAQQYPHAQQYVFGDSYIGVFAENQYNSGYSNWGMQFPSWLYPDGVPASWEAGMGCHLHKTAAAYYPEAKLGFYTSNADQVQTSYYKLGGGGGNWTDVMREHVECLHKDVANMRTFIAAGDAHCVSQSDGFFNVTSRCSDCATDHPCFCSGTSLTQWVADLVDGRAVSSVDCAASGGCAAENGASLGAVPANYSLNIPYRQCKGFPRH